MPRRPRQEAPEALHHVVVQAASDVKIVVDNADRRRFLAELRRVTIECGWDCIAYCVMTTHAHLVLQTSQPNLGQGMKLLLGRYAFAHNRVHGRRGHLFSNRFWSRRIDRPHYLCCASLYSVVNPVAAGLCAEPAGFTWSSYRETAGLVPPDGLLVPDLLLRTLADDPGRARDVYRELVAEAVVRLGQRRAEERWWRTVEQAVASNRRPAEAGHPAGGLR